MQMLKANVIFFDAKPAASEPWTIENSVLRLPHEYAHTLKKNPLKLSDLQTLSNVTIRLIVIKTGNISSGEKILTTMAQIHLRRDYQPGQDEPGYHWVKDNRWPISIISQSG